MDEVDFKILRSLIEDARASLKILAKRAGVSIPTASFRLRRMVSDGVIEGFRVELAAKTLGLGVSAFLVLRTKLAEQTTALAKLAEMEEVRELYATSGAWDIVAKVSLRDLEAYEAFLREKLGRLDCLELLQASFILNEAKKSDYGLIKLSPSFELACGSCGSSIIDRPVVIEGEDVLCPSCATK